MIRKSFVDSSGGSSRIALQQWGLDDRSQDARQYERFREALTQSLMTVEKDVRDAPLLKQLAKGEKIHDDADEEGTGVFRPKRKTPKGDGSFQHMWQQFVGRIFQGDDTKEQGKRKWPDGRRKSNSQSEKNSENLHAPGSQLWQDLRDAFRIRGQNGLEDRLKFTFYGHVTGSRFTASDVRHQKILADLRYPSEWFPATRTLQRDIHLHVGPTNSGKTYHALKRLERADSGAYAGPLRLLAHEVYTRLNAKGKPCALITGEERRAMDVVPPVPEQANVDGNTTLSGTYSYDMMACTVEMMPLNKTMDVAVIDEIQMIGSAERGWAWTQALLGVKAKEVHLCGEERTVPLIKELCASIGEKLTVHTYQRLSPLMVADSSLNGDLKKLRKGDCIVSFSVMGIHALRKQIERQTGRKVATVYGSLPPETRAQQARLFNDPDNDYDFLVASDAVGMGLNLAIKRVIFEAADKFDGVARRTLSVADIKQIGGRAGRFRVATQVNEKDVDISAQDLSAAKGDVEPPEEVSQEVIDPPLIPASSSPGVKRPNFLPPHVQKYQQETYRMPPSGDVPSNIGIITTLERFDYPIILSAMSSEPEPILTAGLFPPGPVLERFSSYFPPGTPFSYILTRLHELSQMHSRFHLCGLRDQVWIADLIEPVEGLTISDRNIICSSPAAKGDGELWSDLLPELARAIASQTGGGFLEIKSLPLEILDQPITARRDYLRGLERLHKGIVSYLWLSYRFHGIFTGRAVAGYVKGLVEGRIEEVLKRFSFEEGKRRKVVEQREREFLRGLEDFGADAGAGAGARAEEAVVGMGGGELRDVGGVSGGAGGLGGEAEDVIFDEEMEDDEMMEAEEVKVEGAADTAEDGAEANQQGRI